MYLIKSISPTGIKVEPNKHYNFQNYNQIDSHCPSCNSLVCQSLCSSSIDSRFGRQGNELWYSVHRLSPPSALRVIPLPNSITLLPALRLSPIFPYQPSRLVTPLQSPICYATVPRQPLLSKAQNSQVFYMLLVRNFLFLFKKDLIFPCGRER